MSIKKYIENLINDKLEGNFSRFDEIWEIEPDFYSNLTNVIKEQNSWVYLEPKTYDGWYLIKTASGYDIYYQEKGGNAWGTWKFTDKRKAIKFIIEASTGLEVKYER